MGDLVGESQAKPDRRQDQENRRDDKNQSECYFNALPFGLDLLVGPDRPLNFRQVVEYGCRDNARRSALKPGWADGMRALSLPRRPDENPRPGLFEGGRIPYPRRGETNPVRQTRCSPSITYASSSRVDLQAPSEHERNFSDWRTIRAFSSIRLAISRTSPRKFLQFLKVGRGDDFERPGVKLFQKASLQALVEKDQGDNSHQHGGDGGDQAEQTDQRT